MNSTYYKAASSKIWSGRQTPEREYLYQIVKCVLPGDVVHAAPGACIGLVGYACDTGVSRNQGRIGAADGPSVFRSAFGRLALGAPLDTKILDLGDCFCADDALEATQDVLAEIVHSTLKHRIFPMLVGGGHDLVWGHFKGIRSVLKSSTTLGIVNIDAHFDLRPPDPVPNSGTAFHQIALHEESANRSFNYLCLGINPTSNVQSLFRVAERFGVEYLNLESMVDKDIVQQTIHQFANRVDVIYVTVDLDSMYSAFAPGVSAPASIGLSPDIVSFMLNCLLESGKMISFDIAELNPKYDVDARTAKLAAQLAYQILSHQHQVKFVAGSNLALV